MQDVEFSLGSNRGEMFDPTVTMQDVVDTLSKPYKLYLYFGTAVDRPQVFIATEDSWLNNHQLFTLMISDPKMVGFNHRQYLEIVGLVCNILVGSCFFTLCVLSQLVFLG